MRELRCHTLKCGSCDWCGSCTRRSFPTPEVKRPLSGMLTQLRVPHPAVGTCWGSRAVKQLPQQSQSQQHGRIGRPRSILLARGQGTVLQGCMQI